VPIVGGLDRREVPANWFYERNSRNARIASFYLCSFGTILLVNIWDHLDVQLIKKGENFKPHYLDQWSYPRTQSTLDFENSGRKIILGHVLIFFGIASLIFFSKTCSSGIGSQVYSIIGFSFRKYLQLWNYSIVASQLRRHLYRLWVMDGISGFAIGRSASWVCRGVGHWWWLWLILHSSRMLICDKLLTLNLVWVPIAFNMGSTRRDSTAPAVTAGLRQSLMPHARFLLAILRW